MAMTGHGPSLTVPGGPRGGGAGVLVFDSGVGGLTIVEELRRLAPALAIDYAADTAFFPYGDKSDEALRARLPEVAGALVEAAKPDVFVIACNTASTLALPAVRARLAVPVVGTVPAVKPAAAETASGTIGLLATPGTLRRAYTEELIATHAADLRVVRLGSVELVRLAEAEASGLTPPDAAVAAAQAPLFAAEGGEAIDIVVLACTHFPLLRAALQRTAPRPVRYIDSGAAIARQTLRVLPAYAGEARRPGGRVFVTAPPDEADAHADVFRRFGLPDLRVVEVAAPPAGAVAAVISAP